MPHESPTLADPATPNEVTAAALVDSAEAVATLGWHRRLLSHIPPGQFLRYLGVGLFNTLFGYTTFAVLNFFLHRRNIPASYLFAAALANLINITVAYLGYKFFVFHTRGNYLREWLRALAVYGSAALPSLVILAPFVRLLEHLLPAQLSALHHTTSARDAAPYLANAILTAFSVLYSFFGHKKVTFRDSHV